MFDREIAETIRATEPTDAHLACVADVLLVGTRVVPRESLPEPSPLSQALVAALWDARGWR